MEPSGQQITVSLWNVMQKLQQNDSQGETAPLLHAQLSLMSQIQFATVLSNGYFMSIVRDYSTNSYGSYTYKT